MTPEQEQDYKKPCSSHRQNPLRSYTTRTVHAGRIEQAVGTDAKTCHARSGVFLLQRQQERQQDARARLKVSLRTESDQWTSSTVGVAASTRLSPHLELLFAGECECFTNTPKDVELFTGMRVPAKTQQRLVHRQTFELPQAEQAIEELSADGGKIRIRTRSKRNVAGWTIKACDCMSLRRGLFSGQSAVD